MILQLLFIVWKWINCYENINVKLKVEHYFFLCKPVVHFLENTPAEIIRSRVWLKTKPWNIDQKCYYSEEELEENFCLIPWILHQDWASIRWVTSVYCWGTKSNGVSKDIYIYINNFSVIVFTNCYVWEILVDFIFCI